MKNHTTKNLDSQSEESKPFFQCLADVEPKTIEYAWKDRIPFGALTLLAGIGGCGKSMAMASVCADLTRGRPLPSDSPKDPMSVLLIAAEDDPACVLRPRFEKHGAELSKVFFRDQAVMFNEPTLDRLKALIKEHSIRFIVIDPIVAYLNGRDANKAGDVRSLLNPLAELARESNCAIVIIAHFNKSDSTSASSRFSGSSDFRNAVRSALQVSSFNDEVYVALEKSNYAARAKTLKFKLQNGKVEWLGESDLTADQILAEVSESGREGGALNEAIEFLETELADGPIESETLKRNASSAGISERTLTRARAKLNIKPKKMFGKWMVELSSKEESQTPYHGKVGQVGVVGQVQTQGSQDGQEGQCFSGSEVGNVDQTALFEGVV